MLSAGTPVSDACGLLRSRKFGSMISVFREEYEVIIIDAPPVLPVPDALVVGRWADCAVLAAPSDFSRVPHVKADWTGWNPPGLPSRQSCSTECGNHPESTGLASRMTAASRDHLNPTCDRAWFGANGTLQGSLIRAQKQTLNPRRTRPHNRVLCLTSAGATGGKRDGWSPWPAQSGWS